MVAPGQMRCNAIEYGLLRRVNYGEKPREENVLPWISGIRHDRKRKIRGILKSAVNSALVPATPIWRGAWNLAPASWSAAVPSAAFVFAMWSDSNLARRHIPTASKSARKDRR